MKQIIILQATMATVGTVQGCLHSSLEHEEGYFQAGMVSFNTGDNAPFELAYAIKNNCHNGVGFTVFFDGKTFLASGDLLEIASVIDELPDNFINDVMVVEFVNM